MLTAGEAVQPIGRTRWPGNQRDYQRRYAHGIGWQADWSLATWANMTTANWDQTRATALSQVHLPVGNLLNVLTGFIPAFDNGIDQAGGSYPSIGARFRATLSTSTTPRESRPSALSIPPCQLGSCRYPAAFTTNTIGGPELG